jgi:hypothetical protein
MAESAYTWAMRSIRPVCASVFAVALLFLSGLHVYWALGGKWGSSATVPTIGDRRTFNPSARATYAVAFLLFIAAVTVWGQASAFVKGPWLTWFAFGSWCISGVFLLRAVGNLKTFGVFKTVHGTPFASWDTRLYTPLCLALALLAGIVASGRSR